MVVLGGRRGTGASVSWARTRARARIDWMCMRQKIIIGYVKAKAKTTATRGGDGGRLRQRVEHVGECAAWVATKPTARWRARVMYMVESTTVVMWA